MTPQLSVVLTVFNGQHYVSQTLTSILAQSFGDFELLINDDGSQDATWELVSAFAARDGRIQLYRNATNQGVPASMNRLFRAAVGQLITRHDADDLSRPERFARQIAALQQQPELGVLGTRVQFIGPSDEALDVNYFMSPTSNAGLQAALLRSNCLCQGSVMFRRALLDQVGLYDPTNIGSEDYDLWLRLAEVTQLAVLDEVLYDYRLHPTSLSHRRRHVQTFHAARALDLALQRRFGAQPPPDHLAWLAQFYLQAGVMAFVAGDSAAARDYVQHAVQANPRVFEDVAVLTQRFLPEFTRAGTAEALQQVPTFFQVCCPAGRPVARLRANWLADIHMQAVFHDRQRLRHSEWRQHLWLGIKYKPAWLLNRGVLALVAKG